MATNRGRTGQRNSPEHNAAISAAMKGNQNGLGKTGPKPAISTALKGRPISESQATNLRKGYGKTGTEHPHFKGDDIGYAQAHQRALKALPAYCAECGASGRLDCALRGDTPIGRIKVQQTGIYSGILYSASPQDYVRLCRRCHKQPRNRPEMLFREATQP